MSLRRLASIVAVLIVRTIVIALYSIVKVEYTHYTKKQYILQIFP